MKNKILALLLSAALLTSFTACSSSDDSTDDVTTAGDTETNVPEETTASLDDLGLQAIMDMTLAGSGQEFSNFFSVHPVTAEDAGYFLGAESFTASFEEGLGYAPMMGSIAFQMILFRLPEGADAEAFASTVKESADPVKWICVQADAVETAIRGRTVLFIMADAAVAESIVNAFNAVDPANYDPNAVPADPMADVSLSDMYSAVRENGSFLTGAHCDSLNADNAKVIGLDMVDLSTLTDSLIDYELESDNPYVIAFFRLEEGVDVQGFIATLYGMDGSILPDAWPTVAYSGNVVALLLSESDDNYNEFMPLLVEQFGMTEFSLI